MTKNVVFKKLPKENIKTNILIIILTIIFVYFIIIITPKLSSTEKNSPKTTYKPSNYDGWREGTNKKSDNSIKFYNKSNDVIYVSTNENIDLTDYQLISIYNCSNKCNGIAINETYSIINDNETFYLYDYYNNKLKEIIKPNINLNLYDIDKLITTKDKIEGLIVLDKSNKYGYYNYLTKTINITSYDRNSLEYINNNLIEFYNIDNDTKTNITYVNKTTGKIVLITKEKMEILHNNFGIYFLKKVNEGYNVYNYNGILLLNGQIFKKELMSISNNGNLIIYDNDYQTYNLYNKDGIIIQK